jgi:putative SOS response-associated peptidase YedK
LAKDLKVGFANINAKAEGIETRPAFRQAFERRRCLVPVDNVYEWKKTGTGKQPYAIALANRGIMALAGLWENWKSPAGEWVRSFAIVTTEPNELCAQLPNRMPVVLAPEAWPAWLGEEPADPAQLKSLMVPYPSGGMVCWPVSTRVVGADQDLALGAVHGVRREGIAVFLRRETRRDHGARRNRDGRHRGVATLTAARSRAKNTLRRKHTMLIDC